MRLTFLFCFIVCSTYTFGQNADTLQYVLGKVDYAASEKFVQIPSAYANREGMYLRKEALEAFKKMREAAQKDGVQLTIISAARNFNHQKRIWEAKWNGNRLVNGKNLKTDIPEPGKRAVAILKYSSMPGTSRHHWGTDIDINSLSPSYFESGKGKKEYEWLRDNADQFGFCQVYSEKGMDRVYGYEEEKWHWSYVPIASKYTRFFERNVSQKDITGFDGSDALQFSLILNYVTGIASHCK